MNQKETELSPRGTDYIMALIRNVLDPDSPLPPAPKLPNQRNQDRYPKSTELLEQQMARLTGERIAGYTRQIRQDLFHLSEGQLRTLENLDLPPESQTAIRKLNGMIKVPTHYEINRRLEVIGQTPSTQEGQKRPNWEEWWLDQMDSRMGVYRPQDHNPQEDLISETLNTAIARIAHEAVQHLPDHTKIAERIRNHPDRKKQDKLRLSEVWTGAIKIHALATRLGLATQDIQTNWRRTSQDICHEEPGAPENILGEIPELVSDMGSITGLATLREKLPETGTREIWASARSRIWYQKNAKDSYLMGTNQDRVHTRIMETGEEDSNLSQAELKLIELCTPEHPGLTDILMKARDRAASAIAFINMTTPDEAREYLNHNPQDPKSQDPSPRQHDPCPMAAQCPTWCGRLQATREFPFPPERQRRLPRMLILGVPGATQGVGFEPQRTGSSGKDPTRMGENHRTGPEDKEPCRKTRPREIRKPDPRPPGTE